MKSYQEATPGGGAAEEVRSVRGERLLQVVFFFRGGFFREWEEFSIAGGGGAFQSGLEIFLEGVRDIFGGGF